jgi:hypothetical protein
MKAKKPTRRTKAKPIWEDPAFIDKLIDVGHEMGKLEEEDLEKLCIVVAKRAKERGIYVSWKA